MPNFSLMFLIHVFLYAGVYCSSSFLATLDAAFKFYFIAACKIEVLHVNFSGNKQQEKLLRATCRPLKDLYSNSLQWTTHYLFKVLHYSFELLVSSVKVWESRLYCGQVSLQLQRIKQYLWRNPPGLRVVVGQNYVPKLFTSYCKLSCYCFKYLIKRNFF